MRYVYAAVLVVALVYGPASCSRHPVVTSAKIITTNIWGLISIMEVEVSLGVYITGSRVGKCLSSPLPPREWDINFRVAKINNRVVEVRCQTLLLCNSLAEVPDTCSAAGFKPPSGVGEPEVRLLFLLP